MQLGQNVLILGGYGAFGTRLCTQLARAPGISLHVAGRRGAVAATAVHALGAPGARAAEVDRDSVDDVIAYVKEHSIQVVVDAVGPYHGRNYDLPKAIAAQSVHAIDLADDRAYVAGIRALDAHARAHDALIAAGCSTVPALSSAVVVHLVEGLDSLDAVEIGISPGHRSPRGLATVRSVLSYCGKEIPALRAGHATTVRGWGNLSRHEYPHPVGTRWLSNVDLPDGALLTEQYPGIESITLKAGLELSVLHLGLSSLSALVARGSIESLVPAAPTLRRIANLLHVFGSDAGAMYVTARGEREGRRVARHWTVVAEHDDGPYLPVAAASALTKRLLRCPGYEPIEARGATPCVGLLALTELMMELKGRAIRSVQRED